MSVNPLKTILLITCIVFSNGVLSAQVPVFQVNGDAVQVDDFCYELTQAVNTQSGSIWNLNQLNLDSSFILKFLLNFGDSDSGADGIYFALQPVSTSVGGTGGGIGFDGISPALGVEFDTYENIDNADLAADHLAIQINGDVDHNGPNNLAGPVPITDPLINVEDGNDHLVYIVWTASKQTLRILFDCAPRLIYLGDIINDVFNGDPNVFWGFTAATGGENNLHKVCLLDATFFDLISDTTICQGDTVQLLAPLGDSYTWSPEDGLDDPNSQTPMANPTQTTIYTITVLDQCGTPDAYQLTVTVEDCLDCVGNTEIVEIDSTFLTFCPDSSVQLQATGASSYEWTADPTLSATDISNPIVTPDTTTWYYVTGYSIENCPTIDSVLLFASLPPDVPANWETNVCNGITQTVNVGNLPNANGWTYSWFPTTGLDNPNIFNPTATVSETTVYTATVISAQGCPATQIATINFTNDVDSIDFGTVEICFGGKGVLDASIISYDDFEWEDNSIQPTLTVDTAGTYNVQLLNTETGCVGFGQFEVIEGDREIVVQNSVSFCEGDSIEFLPGNFQSYEWDNGSEEASIYVSSSGQSSVTVVDEQNCISELIFQHQVTPLPQPTIIGDTFFFVGQTALLSVNQNYAAYNWSTGATSAQISVAEAGVYTVEVIDDQSCKGTSSIEVFTKNPTTLLVPEAFTPNSDGINDMFRLISSEPLNDFSMKVFNRWGQLLYETDQNDGWDGTFNNKNVPIGVYLYFIEATKNDDTVEMFKGNVSLIR